MLFSNFCHVFDGDGDGGVGVGDGCVFDGDG